MAQEVNNQLGGNQSRLLANADNRAALRAGDTSQDPSSAAQDARNASEARRLAQSADPADQARAVEVAQQIRDPQTRIVVYNAVTAGVENTSIPQDEFNEFGVGMKDPLKLFFMMVFYLNRYNPQLSWDDVLNTAQQNAGTGSDFSTIQPVVAERSSVAANTPLAEALQREQDALDEATSQEDAALDTATQRERDALADAGVTTSGGANAAAGGAADTIVWPFQSLPEVDGFSKDVDWPTDKQYSTLAEPILSHNKGAGPVETSLNFRYAVGIGGLSSTYDGRGVENEFWTVENVMAMAYLAMSLVYPFKSINMFQNTDERGQEQNPEAQFPLIFLRHWQLFPFLTPFVVKSVEVTPDDDQPMIIDRPLNLGSIDSHVSIPACRQILDIKLNLLSAHYYMPAFGREGGTGDQIQAQTSGKTFLDMAKTLLAGRV